MRFPSSVAVVMLSLAALDAEAQQSGPNLQLEVMQAEGGRTVSEAVAALPTLQPALEACRPSAERAYPHTRLVAQLSLSNAGVVSAVQLRDADAHPTTPEWHACATAALRGWHLARGTAGSLVLTMNWQTPMDQLREMGVDTGGNWGFGNTAPRRANPAPAPIDPVRIANSIPTTAGSLTSAQISAGLRRIRVQIQECVHANLPTNLTFPELRVEVRLAILREGVVTRVEHVQGPSDASEALTTCLVQVASQMRFEAAPETTMAAFAWVLRPPPVSSVPAPTAPR